jgi:hypothetical protein
MKVFVSSTSTDLGAHRAAAIRSLRRLGHQVIAMEDFTAATAYPLDRVLSLVRSADGFVLIVAWRYGYIPQTPPAEPPPGAPAGSLVSITEWEYLAAREKPERTILPFVLAEAAPWSPRDMDGFDPSHPGDPGSTERVRAFRARLMREHVVSSFSDAEQLESLVGVAVASARLTRQVAINRIGPGNPLQGDATTPDSSYAQGILEVIRDQAAERVITIDISKDWWSTRLYLLAYLLQRFTAAQRILVVAGGSFVGLLPLSPAVRVIGTMHPQLARFEETVRRRTAELDVMREAEALVGAFATEFAAGGSVAAEQERAAMYCVTAANLARWFPDALLTNPLRLQRVDPASPLDLVRIFDYPGDFVPVIVEQAVAETEQQRCHVIDKAALSVQLARAYVTDLLDESRI